MFVNCIWEHNGQDTLLYAENFTGAFTRGKILKEALLKIPQEVNSYLKWLGEPAISNIEAVVVQEKDSSLNICDADSDVIFDSERLPMELNEYVYLKELCLKSAYDFDALYALIPDKDKSLLQGRDTFYGVAPRTAREMYMHTKNVNDYYFGEIGVVADNEGSISENRKKGFAALENVMDFLSMPPVMGSHDEWWSLRKVIRRFIWHDRIHAKAMYRRALKAFNCEIKNVYCFC